MLPGVTQISSVLEAYSGRRVLITGAGGFIGRALARLAAHSAAQVWAVVRPGGESSLEDLGHDINVVVSDLSLLGSFSRIYLSVRPHITFHLVSYGVDPSERDPTLADQVNHALVGEVAEIISSGQHPPWPGVQLVRTGSAAEYGRVDGPVREDSPTRPVSLYGRTKLAGTWALSRAIQSGALCGVTARLFTVYGPGEHPVRLLPSLVEAARTHARLQLTAGEQRRDFTYVGDVAEGLLRLGACSCEAAPIVNVATGELHSVREFAETAAQVLGMMPEQLGFGALPYRPDEAPHGPVDVSRLESLAGWRPRTTIAEGVEQTARLAGLPIGARN
jgi:nucleoside-diphosphate-sugar epimerase